MFNTLKSNSVLNKSYLSDSDMGFILKMEKNTIFVLEMMAKSSLEKFILQSLCTEDSYFYY